MKSVFDEDLKGLRRQVEMMADSFKAQNEQVARQINSWRSDYEKQALQVKQWAANFHLQTINAESFQKAFAQTSESITRSIESLPPKTQAALITLANNGWYIDPDLSIPAIFRIAEAFTPEDVSEANDAMCEYFDGQIVQVEQRLTELVPERARLLSVALTAHRRGEYALSIPVFLAQADGICHQITGVQLYSRDNGKPKLAKVLKKQQISSFVRSMLSPIIEPSPISASGKERVGMVDILNRHCVLHGESTDYDNRLNSCRAISLVVYVAWILQSKGMATGATP
jgi:hypothetical protein